MYAGKKSLSKPCRSTAPFSGIIFFVFLTTLFLSFLGIPFVTQVGPSSGRPHCALVSWISAKSKQRLVWLQWRSKNVTPAKMNFPQLVFAQKKASRVWRALVFGGWSFCDFEKSLSTCIMQHSLCSYTKPSRLCERLQCARSSTGRLLCT